jgi:hypothetical protein
MFNDPAGALNHAMAAIQALTQDNPGSMDIPAAALAAAGALAAAAGGGGGSKAAQKSAGSANGIQMSKDDLEKARKAGRYAVSFLAFDDAAGGCRSLCEVVQLLMGSKGK